MNGTFPEDGVSAFLGVRSRLFGIAYRVLGSATEAEDVVQDAWVRWQTTDRSQVRNARAFLVAATMRLAINVRQSARVRREGQAPESFPEPIDTSADPASGAERADALKSAVLRLDTLSPTERAAYVLREAFSYPHRTIAGLLRVNEANVRQLVARARARLSGGWRAPIGLASQTPLLNALLTASRTGDLTTLERLLVSDIVANAERRHGHSLNVRQRPFASTGAPRRRPTAVSTAITNRERAWRPHSAQATALATIAANDAPVHT